MDKRYIRMKALEMALLYSAALPESEKKRMWGEVENPSDPVEYLRQMDDIITVFEKKLPTF